MFVTIKQRLARFVLAASVFIVVAAFQVIPAVFADPACGVSLPGC